MTQNLRTKVFIAAAALALSLVVSPALACTPIATTPAQQRAEEDRQLLGATILFRGVIEDLHDPDNDTTMVIRRTQTLWGDGAPERINIVRYYFATCPLGNLWAAEASELHNGLGVTVLGDAAYATEDGLRSMFVLVDGDPDTQRLLSRFRELKRAQ